MRWTVSSETQLFYDAGCLLPAIPEAARQDLLRHRIDPTGLGRPAGIALVVADAAATTLDATLEVREDGGGRVELWIVLPKS